jgi:hypothetical protein
MSVCNDDISKCYSDNPDGGGALLELSLNGGTVSMSDFALYGSSDQSLPAPVVTAGASVTPEPNTILLMGTGLLGIGFRGFRRKRKMV